MSKSSEPGTALTRRFARFCLIGGTVTALHYGLLVVLVEGLQANPTASSTAGYVVMSLLNYRLNYTYTFRSDVPHQRVLPRFAMVAISGMALNGTAMYLLNHLAGLYYLVAQVAATGITLVWNFAANHFWSFQPETRAS
jgi:putative flippase GtrA